MPLNWPVPVYWCVACRRTRVMSFLVQGPLYGFCPKSTQLRTLVDIKTPTNSPVHKTHTLVCENSPSVSIINWTIKFHKNKQDLMHWWTITWRINEPQIKSTGQDDCCTKSPTAQDVLQPIPGLISCAGVPMHKKCSQVAGLTTGTCRITSSSIPPCNLEVPVSIYHQFFFLEAASQSKCMYRLKGWKLAK